MLGEGEIVFFREELSNWLSKTNWSGLDNTHIYIYNIHMHMNIILYRFNKLYLHIYIYMYIYNNNLKIRGHEFERKWRVFMGRKIREENDVIILNFKNNLKF